MSAATRPPRVVIVGAGITGLTAAWAVARARPEAEVLVLEARERAGGNIVTERREGFLLDGGPDSFLRTKPDAIALCKELGLEDELISPRDEARKVYVVHDGGLTPMPGGMALAVPTRIRPMLSTPLLGLGAKLRMLGDFVVRAPETPAEDESIEDFVARRFGRQAAERLASPLLGGIYAGDVSKLSIRATFPQLLALEQKHGSLIRGLLTMQMAQKKQLESGAAPSVWQLFRGWLADPDHTAQSPFMSLRGGMGSLISALTSRLPRVRTNTPVRAVQARGDAWDVVLEDGERIEASAVILAAPAHAAARMVPDEKLSTELGAIPYLSTATVFFALDAAQLERPLDGVGFVAPKGTARILAGTWVSSKWEDRAPAGRVLVRAFLGGAKGDVDVTAQSDAELIEIAKAELSRLMGRFGTPLLSRVFRYHDSNPQPVVGHGARLERIAERLQPLPGIEIAGAAYEGVGIPDCVKQGRAAASRVVARLG